MSASARKVTQAPEAVSFEYNEEGVRVRKIATSTGTTNYIYHGNKLVHLTNGSDSMHFFYDAQGRVAVVDYNGTPYIYLHNLQGDITGLVGQGNVRVVNYWYDAWGRHVRKDGCLASTLGTLQPFRYRGYVYDEETGLYYLLSRYYNPEWGRFLNGDTPSESASAALCNSTFTYSSNNPVMRVDQGGTKDYIFTAPGIYHCENDWGILEGFNITRYYIEYNGVRYRANSVETGTRARDERYTQWSGIDLDFQNVTMPSILAFTNQKPTDFRRVWRESVSTSQKNGELDFKTQLAPDKLYMINGVLYNRNEAGNYMWAYHLCLNGFNGTVSGLLAQGGSIKQGRLDEWWDRKARWEGVKDAYKKMGLSFVYSLTYDLMGYPQP